MEGHLPYRDIEVEYPPYALPLFILPALLGNGWYLTGFAALTFVTDWMVKHLLLATGLRESNTIRALLPLLLYSVAVPFLRYIFLQRYDIFPALICVVAIGLFCSGRYGWSGVAIALGTGVKVYPALFVPAMLLLAADAPKRKRFLIGLTAGFVPLLLLSFFLPWWRFAAFHAGRGLQVESLYASVLWTAKWFGLADVKWESTQKWFEVHGPAAAAILPWTRLLFLGAVVFSVVLVAWRIGWKRNGESRNAVSVARLARGSLVPLLAFIAFNQVLSPQYMIWLLPLAALASLEGAVWPMALMAAATMLTPVIYPSFGNYARGLNVVESLVLLSRNLMLAGAWLFLVRELWTERRAKARGIPLLPVIVGLAASAPQTSSALGLDLTEPGLAYKAYLQEKPPIKRILYEESAPNLKSGEAGFFTVDGATQPSGYFVRFLTNSPFALKTVVSGLSSSNEWEYYPDGPSASYSPRHFWTNWQASMNIYSLVDLQTVACLGLPRPFADDFRWTSQTEFTFTYPWGQCAGRITKFDGNRPTEVEYETKKKDGPLWRKCRIVYEYDGDRDFPPSRFVRYLMMDTGEKVITNILHTLDIGLDDKVTEGYFFRDFFPKDGKLSAIYFSSNNVRYVVQPDGSVVEYKYPSKGRPGAHPIRYSIIIVFLALLITTAVYLVRRRGIQ